MPCAALIQWTPCIHWSSLFTLQLQVPWNWCLSAKAKDRNYASTKGRATFLKKQLIMLRQSKDRLIYLYKESEAKLYQVLVPCSSAGYLFAPNVSVAWPIWNICFTRRSLAYIKPLILTKLVSLHKTINTNKPVVEVIKWRYLFKSNISVITFFTCQQSRQIRIMSMHSVRMATYTIVYCVTAEFCINKPY